MSKKWTEDPGLQIRMAASFIILGILSLFCFFGGLHYLGVELLPIHYNCIVYVFDTMVFLDKIVLWTLERRFVSEQEYPRLHEIIRMLASNNNLPKPKVAIVNSQEP